MMRPTAPGEALEAALAAKHVTQAALAEHLDVNPSTVNHWIKNRRKLTIEDVARIAEFLAVDPATIAFPATDAPGPVRTRAPRAAKRKPTPKRKAA